MTKVGFSFLCLFYVVVLFGFACVKFIFLHYCAKRLAEKNVSEVTYFCVEWDVQPHYC